MTKGKLNTVSWGNFMAYVEILFRNLHSYTETVTKYKISLLSFFIKIFLSEFLHTILNRYFENLEQAVLYTIPKIVKTNLLVSSTYRNSI